MDVQDLPPEAASDLELRIAYREEGSAARVFDIAANLIHALEDVDSVFVKSVDSSIQTSMIIEDLQKSSNRILLKNLLKADDDALKSLDWKPLGGQYLVKAKYAVLRWPEQGALEEHPPQIVDLTDEIARLARDTDVRHLPDYPAPNPTRLVQSLERLQSVKRRFRDGEKLTITLGKEDYQVQLETDWSPLELVKDATGPKELVNGQELYLLLYMIDLPGGSQWTFKLGKTTVRAAIADSTWKKDCAARKVTILPGDALHVILRVEQKYSERGELTETKHSITRVIAVIPQSGETKELFSDDH
jgi:hypothetical protein